MKFFVISDNVDTYMGMRLCGMPGTVVHEPEEIRQALQRDMKFHLQKIQINQMCLYFFR